MLMHGARRCAGAAGNLCAGMLAKLMGLPIAHLFVATNENDVLHRLFATGEFRVAAAVTPTVSPAMDIGVRRAARAGALVILAHIAAAACVPVRSGAVQCRAVRGAGGGVGVFACVCVCVGVSVCVGGGVPLRHARTSQHPLLRNWVRRGCHGHARAARVFGGGNSASRIDARYARGRLRGSVDRGAHGGHARDDAAPVGRGALPRVPAYGGGRVCCAHVVGAGGDDDGGGAASGSGGARGIVSRRACTGGSCALPLSVAIVSFIGSMHFVF